jgi:DNA (cytosine-5)-methyltransferase 1
MSPRPKALDLFCGAGGASMGLHRAGFDVVGVDIEPMPEYPTGDGFTFVQADALTFPLGGFDFIWASPKCQRWSPATRQSGTPEKYPDQIVPVRERLRATGKPYVIENVLGAPLFDPIMLCGAMFGLGVVRHRLFECSFFVLAPPHPKHEGSLLTGEYVTVAGNGGVPSWTYKKRESLGLPRFMPDEMALETWQTAMGIDWMSRKTLVQAIPPAYAEWICKRSPALTPTMAPGLGRSRGPR